MIKKSKGDDPSHGGLWVLMVESVGRIHAGIF